MIVRFKAKQFINNSSLLQILFVKTGVTTKTSDVTDCFSSINKSYSKKQKNKKYMEYSDLEGGQCLPHLAQAAMKFEYLSGLQDKGHKVFCAILAQPLEVRCL